MRDLFILLRPENILMNNIKIMTYSSLIKFIFNATLSIEWLKLETTN